jgi:hypothetical protein
MGEFADALGIRNAVTCYEYLKEADGDGVEGWEQFVHVPDRTDELARLRQKDAAILEEKRRLAQEGRLLAERGGFPRWGGPRPYCVPWSGGGGFLAVWSSTADPPGDSRPVERHGSPWSAGPAATRWAIGPRIYDLAASMSGRYLATAAVNRGTEIWDVHENRVVLAVASGMTCLGFMADETALVGIKDCNETAHVVITAIDGRTPHALSISGAVLVAAHPSGAALVVVDHSHRLLVVDVASGRVLRRHFVGGRRVPTALESQLAAQMSAAWANVDVDALVQQIKTRYPAVLKSLRGAAGMTGENPGDATEDVDRQLEQQVRGLREDFGSPTRLVDTERGCNQALVIRFDASGNRLLVATDAGVQVYAWGDMLAARDGDLRPAQAVHLAGAVVDRGQGPMHEDGWIYGLDHDPARNRLLFGGLDGHLRFLDLDSGNSGLLLSPPGLPPIRGVVLSRDRATLCLVADKDFLVHGPNLRGPVLQFWDYEAISQGCSAAGGLRQ